MGMRISAMQLRAAGNTK